MKRYTPLNKTEAVTGMRLASLSINEGIAYLVQTYGMHEDDAREKVLIAKGVIGRDSHEIPE